MSSITMSPLGIRTRLFGLKIQSKPICTLNSRYTLRSHRFAQTSQTRSYQTLRESASRVSTIFTALLLLGVGVTSYGLYEFYSTFTTWPKELRPDLRSGVKAEYQGDYKVSEAYFRRAWDKARILTPDQLGGQYHLKVSGIAIALAAVLEKQNNMRGAYDVYAHAFADIIRVPTAPAPNLTGPERMRAVGLSMKLAELASKFGQREDEERYLVFGVEEILRMMKDEATTSQEDIEELKLPTWVTQTDAGSALERLGEFYSRTGKPDYAVPLYLQALSILLPPSKSPKPTIADRCRGAMLMNNLAELFATPSPSRKANVEQATAWAKKGLAVAQKAQRELTPDTSDASLCESVLAVLVYNLGMLSEKKDDITGARALFKQALQRSTDAGFEAGKVEAERAIARTSSV